MLCDYKIAGIIRKDNLNHIYVMVRFYEGEVTTDETEKEAPTRYRRTNMIGEKQFKFKLGTTDDEIRNILNKKLLGLYKNHTSIDSQKTFTDSPLLNAKVLLS